VLLHLKIDVGCFWNIVWCCLLWQCKSPNKYNWLHTYETIVKNLYICFLFNHKQYFYLLSTPSMGKTSIVHNLGSHLESSRSEDWKVTGNFTRNLIVMMWPGLNLALITWSWPVVNLVIIVILSLSCFTGNTVYFVLFRFAII
jgi:hypothetical protein